MPHTGVLKNKRERYCPDKGSQGSRQGHISYPTPECIPLEVEAVPCLVQWDVIKIPQQLSDMEQYGET